MLSTGFLTINERYFLRIIQSRIGPNKPSFLGIIIIIIDGIKLFIIEIICLITDFFIMFLLPFLFFFMVFLFFFILPNFFNFINLKFIILFLIFFLGIIVIFLLFIAFFSKSKFRFLGVIRNIRRTINFDFLFFLIILFLVYFFEELIINRIYIINSIFFWVFLIVFLIEINRIPFDFTERESELVRGYNTELRSLIFILVFLLEYLMIFFYRILIRVIFFKINFFGFIILLIYIIIRGIYLRYRYDFLFILSWLIFFPIIFLYFLWVLFY